jgi:N-acetylneuraminic acid mutarotase
VKHCSTAHLKFVKLPGFKIVVHGGQGAQGTGKASVLDDTWQFNLFTLDWSRLTYASDAVPVASNLAVASIMENTAVAFGGLAQDGTPSGKLFWYHAPKT